MLICGVIEIYENSLSIKGDSKIMEKKEEIINKSRNSGIEILKIIAILLIVISHVTQTLYSYNPIFSNEYVLELKYSSKNIQHLILAWFSTFGAHGNLIFFVSSTWFLLDSKRNNIKKIFHILFDVWIISMLFLLIFKSINFYPISLREIIENIFPTTFSLNWYITCYLLVYIIHPYLNEIIYERTKRELLICILIMFTLYQGINYIHNGHFFSSPLIELIVIYFEVAYVKLYLIKYSKNKKNNILFFLLSISVIPLLILLTNFLGMYISFFNGRLQGYGGNHSPFILITAICLFNIFKNVKFYSKTVNFISSMSLLIYIIHENYFVRKYLRPNIWIYFYKNYGYENVVIIDLVISIFIFLISIFISILYKKLLQFKFHSSIDSLCNFMLNKYNKINIK